MYQDNIVLCGASSYEQKYYFNQDFASLPETVKQELQIMCVLFTEDVGGLDFVGFEIDEDYCRAANERLEQEQAQIRLFDLLEQEERKAQATLFTK